MVDALVRACMRTPQAARYIAISKSRLSQLRMTGEGPPFIKIAARPVAYAKIDLYSWLESRVRSHQVINRPTTSKTKGPRLKNGTCGDEVVYQSLLGNAYGWTSV